MKRYTDIERVARRQAGRITWAQLRLIGLTEMENRGLVRRGLLIRVLPKVYAVGHTAPSRPATLWEAVLYAGPGATLSYATAAHHHGLINFPPRRIEVSTPRRIGSLSAIRVYGRRRSLTRAFREGLPVTDPRETVLDLAAVRPDLLPHALGQLDFRYRLDPVQLRGAMGTGRPGSAAFEAALVSYNPAWARLKSAAEVDFYAFCLEWAVDPLPTPNHQITPDLEVDGYWPAAGLAVEIDPGPNHHSEAQRYRDNRRDLECRRLGVRVLRYSPAQFRLEPAAVPADLTAQLTSRGTPVSPRGEGHG